MHVRESTEREKEEGRLEPRLQPGAGNATALNGSVSYSKRDGTICVAQDLFPGDNSVLISRPQPTRRVRGERGRRERESDMLFPFQSLPALSPPLSSHVLRAEGSMTVAFVLQDCNKAVIKES